MSHYLPGDVVLVSLSIDDRSGSKVRPALVIRSEGEGALAICPVSSKPSLDSPVVPLTIDDFAQGGLDLFSESYVLTSRVQTIASREVIGKRGRVLPEYLHNIAGDPPRAQHKKRGPHQ